MLNRHILLLGSGELGKEFVIAAKRLGLYVTAADSYAGAPAMQTADAFEVLDMLNPKALDELVERVRPDIIVPEIEAIRTERLFAYEERGIQVVPSAKAANFTMNRKAIRNLAAHELGLRTAKFAYADSPESFRAAVLGIGLPCVVKPLMSSSGKGQSVLRKTEDIDHVWNYALAGSRGDLPEVIVEEFIQFESEITLLTITQKNGPVRFCPPIGHRQERGDYQESWQPALIREEHLKEACEMASKVTAALGGAGIWGVEFFLTERGVYFSELSPRPHDTGMVTLAGTQDFNEFELHLRAILGLPVAPVHLNRNGASAVILSPGNGTVSTYEGIAEAMNEENTDIRIFGKATARPYRRMGVALCWGNEPPEQLVERAVRAAASVRLKLS